MVEKESLKIKCSATVWKEQVFSLGSKPNKYTQPPPLGPKNTKNQFFDKIDEKRVEALMKRVTNGTFGQVFITDTHLGRIPDMFAATGADVRVFEVRQGEVHAQKEEAS